MRLSHNGSGASLRGGLRQRQRQQALLLRVRRSDDGASFGRGEWPPPRIAPRRVLAMAAFRRFGSRTISAPPASVPVRSKHFRGSRRRTMGRHRGLQPVPGTAKGRRRFTEKRPYRMGRFVL